MDGQTYKKTNVFTKVGVDVLNNNAMPSDSTKLLVDLRKEGLRARWRGQKSTIFLSRKKKQ